MESSIRNMADQSLVSYLTSIHLMPYLYDVTRKASLVKTTCLFSMADQFPNDPVCHDVDSQYMIGAHLLVIPVHHVDMLMEYYLPQGSWTNYLTGKTLQGDKWFSEHILNMNPLLFIRENTILPTAIKEYPGHHAIQFQIYQLQNGLRIANSFYDQYTSKIWPYMVRQIGNQLTISSDANMLYSFRLINQSASEADHAFLLAENADTVIQPDPNSAITTILL